MRTMLSGIAVLALACASASSAAGQTTKTAACPASNPAVWWVPAAKMYYSKGQAGYGKGTGQVVCRSAALAHKARAAVTKPMTSTMHTANPPAPKPMMSGGAAAPGGMMGSPMPMMTGPGANPTATPAAEPAGPNTPPPPATITPPMPGMSPVPRVSPIPGGPSPAPAAT